MLSLTFLHYFSLTTTMIGRLTLNLRKYRADGDDELIFSSMSLRFIQSDPQANTFADARENV